MWEKQSMSKFSVSALLETDKKRNVRIVSSVIWAQYQGFYSSRGGTRIPTLWAALSSSSLSVYVVLASLQHCWIMSLSMSVYNSTGSSNTPKILRLEISKHFQCLKVLNTQAMWTQQFESATRISIFSRPWYLVRSVKRNVKLIASKSRHTEEETGILLIFLYFNFPTPFLRSFLPSFCPSFLSLFLSSFSICIIHILCSISELLIHVRTTLESKHIVMQSKSVMFISPANDILSEISVICYGCTYITLVDAHVPNMYTFQCL